MDSIINVDAENGIVEKHIYDERDEKMIVQTTYDNSTIIEANKQAQNDAPSIGRYKGNLVHVGRLHMGDIVRLKNLGYDVLAADPAEYRRALLYIQSNEPHLLTVPGKPFAKVRPKWA
jgi:hypothetical protein